MLRGQPGRQHLSRDSSAGPPALQVHEGEAGGLPGTLRGAGSTRDDGAARDGRLTVGELYAKGGGQGHAGCGRDDGVYAIHRQPRLALRPRPQSDQRLHGPRPSSSSTFHTHTHTHIRTRMHTL
jgi:hypothetical protein